MVGQAFATDLLRAPPLPDGVDELDPIGVDDAEHRRSGQEDLRPVLMGLQETKEPRPFGEAGEQRPIVARQPAIEGAIPAPFEGMQQSQGDHLTGPEVRLRMFGEGVQLLINLIEQGGDKFHGRHAALLLWERCHATSMEEAYDCCKPKNLLISLQSSMYIIWFVRD